MAIWHKCVPWTKAPDTCRSGPEHKGTTPTSFHVTVRPPFNPNFRFTVRKLPTAPPYSMGHWCQTRGFRRGLQSPQNPTRTFYENECNSKIRSALVFMRTVNIQKNKKNNKLWTVLVHTASLANVRIYNTKKRKQKHWCLCKCETYISVFTTHYS